MTLKIDPKLEGKLTCAFKKDTRNRALKSLKIGTLMRFFYPKQKMFELKIYQGVMCYENKE